MGKYLDMLKSSATESQSSPEEKEQLAPDKPERSTPEPAHREACWRCGAAPVPPDLDTQVEILRRTHQMKGEPWLWPDSHWARLRTLLRDGDVIVVIKNTFNMLDPNPGAVYVERAGEMVKIDRRELMEG